MEYTLSRSEKKRRAKNIESLAKELVELPPADIKKLPCNDFLKQEISDAKGLKAGARKRQVKYITKQLRGTDSDPLLGFLEERKGSKLKQANTFKELERLRDDLVTEAIQAYRETELERIPFDSSWQSDMVNIILERFPSLSAVNIKTAAIRYAKSRKPTFSKEIFRMLKAAQEQQQFEK